MITYEAETYLLEGCTPEDAADLLGLEASTPDADLAVMAGDLADVCRQDGVRLRHARRALRHVRDLLRQRRGLGRERTARMIGMVEDNTGVLESEVRAL